MARERRDGSDLTVYGVWPWVLDRAGRMRERNGDGARTIDLDTVNGTVGGHRWESMLEIQILVGFGRKEGRGWGEAEREEQRV